MAEGLPAFVLASASVILIDNFTTTVLGFGIRYYPGLERSLYGLLFCLLMALWYRQVRIWERAIVSHYSERNLRLLLMILMAVLVSGTVLAYATTRPERKMETSGRSGSERLPNILLIGSDGINAVSMSAYGYQHDTTPFIREFAKDALICENAFANATRSLSSITSMLTGKLPTQTRLICAPDILRGEDAYEHLPGILRSYGYRSIQLAVRNYADAYDANMRSAFDSVNFRSAEQQQVLESISKYVGQEAAYFLQQALDRMQERLLHIFWIRDMIDPFAEVMHRKRETYPDAKKVNYMETRMWEILQGVK